MTPNTPGPGRSTFVHSDRALARFVVRPVQRFTQIEAGGGVALLVSTVVALAWANSPYSAAYRNLFHTELAVQLGSHRIDGDLTHWVNDALMSLFFLVVGLEIKREWVAGELQDRRAAALPVIAAVGGMAVPAAIYLAINRGGPATDGWGVPMATDIAFALGVVAVLGRRVPGPLKVFLLTLAIVDDIGAILVIALVYSGSVGLGWLAGGALAVATVVGLRAIGVVHPAPYVVLGVVLWWFVYESGVHPTIAGVAMGLLTPARPFQDRLETDAIAHRLESSPELEPVEVRQVSFLIRTSVPLTDRLIDLLHPWTSYLVVPLFALANAGIELRAESFESPGPIGIGVFVGLVAGKSIGVAGASWLAIRLGIARLPDGVRWVQLVGAAILAGIGFTVALFVANLAFADQADRAEAKVAILLASICAAAAGASVLVAAARDRGSPAP